jgi:lipopolysaccharide export system protein LptC
MPKADIGIKDGTWLAIIANTGVYDQNEKTLKLNGSVNLFHDTGYEFNTDSATIDINKGTASSSSNVTGQGPFGNLSAEGLKISNKGSQFLFSGKSKLIIYPGSKK